MKRRLRFSILAAAAQKRASSGRSRRMIAAVAGRVRRLWSSDTHQAGGGAHAEQFLRGYRGRYLQCDGYDGYESYARMKRDEGPWTLVHCWSHLRRRFVKLVRNTKSPIAETAVRHIAALYAIEADVTGHARRRGWRRPKKACPLPSSKP